MTKTQAITLMILKRIDEGETVCEAFDAVLGAGSYDRLASEVYDAIRAEGGEK